jgi:hypothetical protein
VDGLSQLVVPPSGETVLTYDSTNSRWQIAEYRQPYEIWPGGSTAFAGGGSTNNLNLTNLHTFYATPGAGDHTITGMAVGYNGRLVTFVNEASTPVLKFTHQDPNSLAANRFYLNDGFTLILAPGEIATFMYDTRAVSNTGAWRLFALGALVFGASGASHRTGLVPDPGATAGTTRFLREDATWAVPPLPEVTGSHTGNVATGVALDFVTIGLSPGTWIVLASGSLSNAASSYWAQVLIGDATVSPTVFYLDTIYTAPSGTFGSSGFNIVGVFNFPTGGTVHLSVNNQGTAAASCAASIWAFRAGP